MIEQIIKKIKKKYSALQSKYMNQVYSIDGVEIQLGKNHQLRVYQEQFEFYDRYLPYLSQLCKEDERGGVIIDIGANVGDTVAAMIQHTKANFLCIEPNDTFHALLQKNISSFPVQWKRRIQILKAFVSAQSGKNYTMFEHHGTAYKVESTEKQPTKSLTLEECIRYAEIDFSSVEIIKSDTDGFDYECFIGDEQLLKRYSPILYWENSLSENKNAYLGYLELLEYLKECGYSRFFIFDNYGNYLAEGDAVFYKSIHTYLHRLETCRTGRTFYYVDVLACKADRVEGVRKNITAYVKKCRL